MSDTHQPPAPLGWTTLQEVQTWLQSLAAGNTVSVGSSLFDSPAITAMYKIIPPGDDPLSITITSVDVANATLAGTATVLGEDGSTVTFIFTQPDSVLELQVNVAPPSGLSWTLLDSYSVGFTPVEAQFIPNAINDQYVVNLVLSANVTAGANDALTLPITLNVATYAGDWLLQGNFDKVGGLAEDALEALAGNNDVVKLMNGYFDIAELSITDFEVAFNPGAKTCSLIRIGISYDGKWTFFDDKFEVEKVNFDVEVLYPFTSDSSVQGIVSATMEIPAGGTAFDVGAQFDSADPTGAAVFAQLDAGSNLVVSDVFTFFGVSAPASFPDIEISLLSFYFWPEQNAFNFQLGISQPFEIVQGSNVDLDNFTFTLAGTNNGGTMSATGTLDTTFTIGPTVLNLNGSYASGQGLSVTGTATNIELGPIIDAIAAQFGVDSSSIPAPIQNFDVESLTVGVTTGTTNSFNFDFVGTTTISGVQATFNPSIQATWGGASFTAEFGGTVTLTPPSGQSMTFSMEFDKTTAGDWTLTATYQDQGNGLTFEDIAALFGLSLDDVPPNLDLDLTGVGFYYDFTKGDLAFGMQTKTYGSAVFVSSALGGQTTYQFFLLDANQTFSLSNLPLVGAELAQIENIQVQNLTFVVSTLTPVTTTNAGAINQIIGYLKGTYPLVPAAGITGTLLITGNLQFGTNAPTPLSVTMGGSSTTTALAAPGEGLAASSGSDSVTWYNLQKSFGPVSLQRIGAMYQSSTQTLWFELDATLALGPLQLSLAGLGIGSPLTTFAPQFSLSGLGISYTSAPLTISGSFVNLAPPGASYIEFEGGVTIGTGEFTLQAFGFYGNQGGFNSMFIFGDLAYDFGGPPAFFVTGVALGFGYNSDLTIPTINQVATFPFVEVLPGFPQSNTGLFGTNPTPQTVLSSILTPPSNGTAWVVPQAGTLWFAAGITFTSFELVNSQALVIVETGTGLVIALVGVATAQFPQPVDTSNSAEVYAFIQLDLLLRFAPSEGVFSLQAVLAPSSFLLAKACVLTGGFAFFVWFGDNPHSGDFVLTLGGYNSGFTPPPYYPSVPIVGFHWSIDSSITVSGGAYFALTPAVLMFGGRLSATYQSGKLKAWFDAHADVVIRWKPFWFSADIGINVGASYTFDILGASVTASVELGCDLSLWGPPTGGSVTVDWYILKFTIPFGAKYSPGPPISGWTDIENMLPHTSGGSTSSLWGAGALAGDRRRWTGEGAGPTQVLSISPVSGMLPNGTSGGTEDAALWTVRGSQFAFATSSPIPASSATVGATYSFNGSTFNVFPLGASWNGTSATHVITITPQGGSEDCSSAFQAVQVQRSVPASLWGSPPQNSSGGSQTPSGSGQVVPNQIVGVSVTVNPPDIGGSAGPIDVAVNLSGTNLELTGATLAVNNGAQPAGDVPVVSSTTVSTIADPNGGIAASSTQSARNAIFAALQSLGYAPATNNDAMTNFANDAGCAFAAEPLIVS